MQHIDQNFSAKNFGIIYNLLNRKGKIDIGKMSNEYGSVVADIKRCRGEIRSLTQKKRQSWDEEDKKFYSDKKQELKELIRKRAELLDDNIRAFSNEVNDRSFRFSMSMHKHGDNEEFTINCDRLAHYFAICQLQHNLKSVFRVKMPGRHQIMCQIKELLKTLKYEYIIRTDVKGFFESIPQDKLMERLEKNELLSHKSMAFVKSIIRLYEEKKTTTAQNARIGVPRGVGISSMLIEIYMQDLDSKIIRSNEVIYYVRYVDDIFIILSSLGGKKSIEDYYGSLCGLFASYGLILHDKNEEKTRLISLDNPKDRHALIDYLGYSIKLTPGKNGMLNIDLGLSKKRKDKYIGRIRNAFRHFENVCKINVKTARRDLLDSLDLLTGNYRLVNTKSGAKVGVYYSNDLISEKGKKDLESLDKKKSHQSLKVHEPAFQTSEEMQRFTERLKKRIGRLSFLEGWKSKRVCHLSLARISEINKWLYEKTENKTEV